MTKEYGQGFTISSLSRMLKFAELFQDEQIVATLSQQLSWSHFVEILPLKEPLKRDFYAEMCRIEKWNVRTLRKKIDSMLYERAAISKRDSKLIYGPNCLTLDELHAILQKHGYSDSEDISAKMIEICTRQNQRLEEENEKLSQQKTSNDTADKLTYMLGLTPVGENTDKVLKYERSLQKSIFQNLLMLKNCRDCFKNGFVLEKQ